MKISIIIVRTLMGLLFIFSSVAVLFDLMPQPEMTGRVKLFMDGMIATGYLLTLIKATELICGLAFVTGYFVPLAAVVIAPVVVNIFLFHAFVEPSGMIMATILLFANVFLGYSNWSKYKPMLAAK